MEHPMLRHGAALAAAALLLIGLAPARAELVVSVSKSQQRLSVVVDGAVTPPRMAACGCGRTMPRSSIR